MSEQMTSEPARPERAQTWSARGYDTNARFVSEYGVEILNWLAPQPGERILDLGCGDGVLSARIVEAGAEVVGADTSEDFLRAARERGIDARFLDGEALPFEREFDAVFSNAALHWMRDADAVIEGVKRALKPGGRFVAEFGGHGNVAACVTAMRAAADKFGGDPALAGPWFFPTPEAYSARLEKAGFSVGRTELAARPTPLPTGMEGWLMTFRSPFFEQFGHDKEAVIAYVTELLRPVLQTDDGQWFADYIRLRVAASLDA
ncbi:MAG: class I SAM-dependent methyltransferase [Dichotomicrobium sp.]